MSWSARAVSCGNGTLDPLTPHWTIWSRHTGRPEGDDRDQRLHREGGVAKGRNRRRTRPDGSPRTALQPAGIVPEPGISHEALRVHWGGKTDPLYEVQVVHGYR